VLTFTVEVCEELCASLATAKQRDPNTQLFGRRALTDLSTCYGKWCTHWHLWMPQDPRRWHHSHISWHHINSRYARRPWSVRPL